MHPSWYTLPPGDFGYVYGSGGGASTSFGNRAREEGDEDDDEDEEGDKSMTRVLAPSRKPFCRIEDTAQFGLGEVLCLWSP